MFTNRAPKPVLRKVKFGLYTIIGGGFAFYNPLVNTYGLEANEKLHALKSADNKIVALPFDLRQMSKDILDNVKIKQKKKLNVKFFTVNSLDVITLGSLDLSRGTRIGIPYTYSYEKPDQVDPAVVTSIIGEKKFISKDWYNSEDGKRLINAIPLSKEARKFAIARGIMHADSELSIAIDVSTLTMVGISVLGYEFLEPKAIELIGKSPGILLLSTVILSTMIPLYLTCKNMIIQYFHKRTDTRTLKQPSDDYRKGAVEYYEKLMERNKMLRNLLVDGSERFDENGSPIQLIQKVSIPLGERLENCKNVIEEWEKESPVIIPETL